MNSQLKATPLPTVRVSLATLSLKNEKKVMVAMETNQQTIAVLESELSRLLGWIQAAETKISLVLALSTAMLGVLAVLSPVCSGWTLVPAIFASIATLLLVLSLIFSAVSSFPRTDGPGALRGVRS